MARHKLAKMQAYFRVIHSLSKLIWTHNDSSTLIDEYHIPESQIFTKYQIPILNVDTLSKNFPMDCLASLGRHAEFSPLVNSILDFIDRQKAIKAQNLLFLEPFQGHLEC